MLPDVEVRQGLQVEQALGERAQAVLVQVEVLQRHEHTHLHREVGQPVPGQVCTERGREADGSDALYR